MSYGFFTTTDEGLLQIASDFTNLAVISQGSWTQATFNVYAHQISEYDIYFLRVTQEAQYVYAYTSYFGGILYLKVGTTTDYPTDPTGPGIVSTVEYLQCRPSNQVLTTPPVSGYGLNIMKADGNLVFSSDLQYPQITNIVNINTSGLDLNGSTKHTYNLGAVLPGKKRYFGCNSFGNIGVLEWSPDFGTYVYNSGCFISAKNNSSGISVKISNDWIEGLTYSSWRIDSNNQLLIAEF